MQLDRTAQDPSALPRQIGWFTASCVLVSNVVGSGIFTTTGFMARDLGHPGLILSIWLVGGLIALAGALSYSELGAAFPVAGGEYAYLRRAYGPFVGFLSGWTSFTIGFSAAIAAGAVSFTAYLLQLFPLDDEGGTQSTILALALLWSITGFHLAGVGAGGVLQRTLTVLKVGAILLLIAAGLMVGKGDWAHLSLTDTQTVPGIGQYVVSLIFALYAYSGWNAAAYLAGEITDPARTIPRTMIGGTLFVALLYLILNGFYFYALPVTELAKPPILPVADKVARALLGLEAGRFVTAMLCLSITGAVSAMVWAGPRVYYAMAQDGVDSFLVWGNSRRTRHTDQCHPAAKPVGLSSDSVGQLRTTGDLQRHRTHDLQRPRGGSSTHPASATAKSSPSLSHPSLPVCPGILYSCVNHDRRERAL
jgi:APA family basic amino acid/polyamine antiporter